VVISTNFGGEQFGVVAGIRSVDVQVLRHFPAFREYHYCSQTYFYIIRTDRILKKKKQNNKKTRKIFSRRFYIL
jgi:hypothetical protein